MESMLTSGHKEVNMSSKEKHRKRSSVTFSRAEIQYMRNDRNLIKKIEKMYRRKNRSIFSRLYGLLIG
jgi:hypothetical protein